MSWYKTQDQMIHELNDSIFSTDPVTKTSDPMDPIDVYNKHYVMELKNREAYTPERFNGSFIEKIKYDFLVKNCGDKIPGYVCRFKDGSYWAWNLKKVSEPIWRVQMLPKNSHFGDKTKVPKDVGDLTLENGVKLI